LNRFFLRLDRAQSPSNAANRIPLRLGFSAQSTMNQRLCVSRPSATFFELRVAAVTLPLPRGPSSRMEG
jgi:hypothetical protein